MTTALTRICLLIIVPGLLILPGAGRSASPPKTLQLSARELHALKLHAVADINQDRAASGLPPVEFDELASQVADQHCAEVVETGVASHWSRDGRKPYMRFSWAGGHDAVAENLAHVHDSAFPSGNAWLAGELYLLEAGFIMERPPLDGHRLNILTPEHTHVGIGIALRDTHLCYSQEFLNRYVNVDPLPVTARLADIVILHGKVTAPGYKMYAVDIFYEPYLKPMSLETLRQTYSYSLPTESKMLRPVAPEGYTYGDGTVGEVKRDKTGGFETRLQFFRGEPGIYSVVVWVQKDSKPIQATIISIKVDR